MRILCLDPDHVQVQHRPPDLVDRRPWRCFRQETWEVRGHHLLGRETSVVQVLAQTSFHHLGRKGTGPAGIRRSQYQRCRDLGVFALQPWACTAPKDRPSTCSRSRSKVLMKAAICSDAASTDRRRSAQPASLANECAARWPRQATGPRRVVAGTYSVCRSLVPSEQAD
jgi:hypothetical protein